MHGSYKVEGSLLRGVEVSDAVFPALVTALFASVVAMAVVATAGLAFVAVADTVDDTGAFAIAFDRLREIAKAALISFCYSRRPCFWLGRSK